jgi:DNA-binding NtrC family response regulator
MVQSRGVTGAARPEADDARGVVLVVDDDPAQRGSLAALLDDLEVVTASSVAEALVAIRRASFDVVVTDYQLADGSGMAILSALSNASPHTTGILVTGHTELPEVIAARTSRRVFRLVLKPYDPSMLLGWVKSAVTLARMRRSGVKRSDS